MSNTHTSFEMDAVYSAAQHIGAAAAASWGARGRGRGGIGKTEHRRTHQRRNDMNRATTNVLDLNVDPMLDAIERRRSAARCVA